MTAKEEVRKIILAAAKLQKAGLGNITPDKIQEKVARAIQSQK